MMLYYVMVVNKKFIGVALLFRGFDFGQKTCWERNDLDALKPMDVSPNCRRACSFTRAGDPQ